MADWSFLTNNARVLLCIAHDPGVRLRDIPTLSRSKIGSRDLRFFGTSRGARVFVDQAAQDGFSACQSCHAWTWRPSGGGRYRGASAGPCPG
jgi:hypothetical protein